MTVARATAPTIARTPTLALAMQRRVGSDSLRDSVSGNVEVVGRGAVSCVMLASVGAAWSKATLPADLGEVLTIHFVVPSEDARSVAATADELATHAESLQRPRLVAGVSMNGTVALAAAAAHPTVFDGVVAIAAPPRLPPDRNIDVAVDPERQREFDRRRKAAEAAPEGSDEELRLWRRVDAVRRWHDLTFDSAHLDSLAEPNPDWMRAVMADGESHQWQATVASLSCPVLLVLGRSDLVVPVVSWQLDVLAANWSVEVFDRSGHTPCYEEPERFVSAVRDWIAQSF